MVDFLKGFKKTFFKYWVAPWAPFMLIVAPVFAGPTDDNHIHVEQLNGGDNVELNLQQLGYGNTPMLIMFTSSI